LLRTFSAPTNFFAGAFFTTVVFVAGFFATAYWLRAMDQLVGP
jgi:hypothetical protein